MELCRSKVPMSLELSQYKSEVDPFKMYFVTSRATTRTVTKNN